MGIPTFDSAADRRIRAMDIDNVAMEITPAHWYSNFWEGAGKGFVLGGAKSAATTNAAAQERARFGGGSMGTAGGFSAMLAGAQPEDTNLYRRRTEPDELDAQLRAVQEWAKADPRTFGVGAQLANTTVSGLTIMFTGSLVGGPYMGAAMLGAVEGHNAYQETLDAGVDEQTALAMAGLTGTLAGLGALLPAKVSGKSALSLVGLGMQAEVAGNQALASVLYNTARGAAALTTLPGRLATGAVTNVGQGVASRYFTAELLDSAGYKEMAEQYAALDGKAIASDLILGLAFGAYGHMESKLEARGRAGGRSPAEVPDPGMVDAALETKRQEMAARGAAGIPTDPVVAKLDAELADRATADLVRGEVPRISPDEAMRVADGVLVDPQRVELHQDWLAANRAVFGDVMDFTEPAMLRPDEAQVAPIAPEAPGVLKIPGESTDGGAKASPLMQEQAAQLAARHPDLEVTLDDGRTVTAAELPEVLAETVAAAEKDGRLFDAAVACFLRTSL